MVLKLAHIVLIFSGLALIYGTQLVLYRIARSGDAKAIRTAFQTAKPLSSLGPAIFLVGVAFGVAAGVLNGWNLLAPWLVAAYVLVAALMAGGITITMPWMNRVSVAAASVDGHGSPTGLGDVLRDRRAVGLMYASAAADVCIVALMVFKPGA